jgi:hypothetical protein
MREPAGRTVTNGNPQAKTVTYIQDRTLKPDNICGSATPPCGGTQTTDGLHDGENRPGDDQKIHEMANYIFLPMLE